MKKWFDFSRKICLIFLLSPAICPNITKAQTWIWFPGDYEIWLSNQMQNRRTERGAFYPPFWKLYSPYNLVDFVRSYDLKEAEEIEVFAEGDYNVKIDGRLLPGRPEKITIPAGTREIHIKIFNQEHVPALFVRGKQVFSDASWSVTFEDKEWIDDSGKASAMSATTWEKAGCWNFSDPLNPPSAFRLATESRYAVSTEKTGTGYLVDFGKESFGYLKFHGIRGNGVIRLYYGESKEEALSPETCETLDELSVGSGTPVDYVSGESRAFRYINVIPDLSVRFDSLSMLYEFMPLEYRGSFRCNDNQINEIWDISAYTLHLNSREFFIDGIKRDRWIWSGDACQSYLMNYYLFFDSPMVRRTLWALRGKEPVTSHINTIMDYTFYWFLGIYDYYLYTGDAGLIRQLYPRMVTLMDFCLGRRNANGMMEGLPGDWVYIDWAPLDKKGEVSFEQLLFARSLETMALCAELVSDEKGAEKYARLAADLKSKLIPAFWSPEKQAFVHSRVEGKQSDVVTRYTNMFAVFFGYVDSLKQEAVKQHVLLNDEVQKITTPYMRFYELEALCALGEHNYVRQEMKNYWGAMLELGATSFWEKYDPAESGTAHYAMYGRPFGKSLCHAWGASPIYLLGKYYLGIRPLAPGYQKYLIEPNLGGLEWMEGSVPAPDGEISLFCSTKEIRIRSAVNGTGILRFKSTSKPGCEGVTFNKSGKNLYEMTIKEGDEYTIKYRNPNK